jgi:two-component system, NarL family, sensor histidine kinase DegS
LVIAYDAGWVKGATTIPGDAQDDPFAASLDDAQRLIQQHHGALTRLYQRLRSTHQIYLARLHEVEERLFTVVQESNAAAVKSAKVTTAEPDFDAFERREEAHALRQEQAWLAERLMNVAAAARRIQAIAQQTLLTSSYLDGEVGDGVDEVGKLVQLHSLQAQEEERRRLARDVHDGPAQVLANAIFETGLCRRLVGQDPARAEAALDQLEGDLRASLAEVRHFIHDLQPGAIAEIGLITALANYLEEFSTRTGIATRLNADPAIERLPAPVELGLFRIIQEALQNVRKHSQARRVRVRIASVGTSVSVSIKDDGVGFDLQARQTACGHYGLTSMSDRARLLRAELSVSSSPGRGTEVAIHLPTEQFASDFS